MRGHWDEFAVAIRAPWCQGSGMARHHSPRHPLFRQRWFADDIIITCVWWYLRVKLSYQELVELARELGVSVAPEHSPALGRSLRPRVREMLASYERPVGDSWRVDETYLKVGGSMGLPLPLC
jgi:transposase-like protein